MYPYMHSLAKNEMATQYSLGLISNNIVKVSAYFEDEAKYSMIMEYSDDPCYFENMLENVDLINLELHSNWK
jgi:hypothetical protein